MLPLLLAAAVAQGPPTARAHDLAGYLALASGYGSGQRTVALDELRQWRRTELDAAVAALRHRGKDLRAVPTTPDDLDFRLVERAVLLHAEAGLLALALRGDSSVDTSWNLRTSTDLLSWSRTAAARLRERVHERIDPRDYYVALASTSLEFGSPQTARPFAREAVRLAPLDGEAHLVLGCVAASMAEVFSLRRRDSDARQSREEAAKALQDALAVDARLAEARLRLGKLLLDEGRSIEAEPLLSQVDRADADARSRYLARLFLGRAAERRGRPAEAARRYERALESWPDSQAARLGLARLLEGSAGPSACAEQVEATLAAWRRQGRAADPWWGYLFGPPGLSRAVCDRLWGSVLGP